MEFSRQEYWSGLPFPSPGVLPNPGIKPRSPRLWADTLPSEPPGNPNSSIAVQQISPYLSVLEHQIVTISGSRGWLGSSRWFCYQNKTGTPGLSHSKVSLLTQACGEGDYSVSARPSNRNGQLVLWRLDLLDDFSSVQSLSHGRLFVTPWIAAHQASLSIANSRSSPKPMSIESMMPSSHLILCCPLFLLPPIPPSIRGLFQWVNSSHEVAQVLEFQL